MPEPKREGGMPLYEALNLRKSSRNFVDSTDKITPELLSQRYGVAMELEKVFLEWFLQQKLGIPL